MKRATITSFLLLALIGTAFATEAPLGNRGRKGLDAKSIHEMLAVHGEEMDVGLGALLIGKEYDQKLDLAKCLTQLDTMAAELCSRIADEKDPEKVIAKINHFISLLSG